MADWHYQGEIPGSKSVFNRALIVQSYFPVLDLIGTSECDDVRFMREGLKEIREHSRIDCGEGGTTFRFLALRASRNKGIHTLMGSERLMQRPQKGLLLLLQQLGVSAKIKKNELFIASDGWKRPAKPVVVDTTESSQYASSLLLNSWLLDFDLEFVLVGENVSESYFLLTLEMMKDLGMRVKKTSQGYLIPAGQRLSKLDWAIEPDLSSTFTMATAGALAGEALITNFPTQSRQPDRVFLDIFKSMHVIFSLQGETLKVSNEGMIKATDWNLSQCPDLFPVLAVLCSWAHGSSKLYGAPHLTKKESNRIAKVADLLRLVGVEFEELPDGMLIHGNPHQELVSGKTFNPDKDHRMVMAATLMKLKGHDIHIEEPHAINKSFPEFWDMIGVKP